MRNNRIQKSYFLIPVSILLVSASIGIVTGSANALKPPVTQSQADVVNHATKGRVGIGVNQPANGQDVALGFADNGNNAKANGGKFAAAFGGDGETDQDGGDGTANGDLVGLGFGGAGGPGSACHNGANGGDGRGTGGIFGGGFGGPGGRGGDC